MEDACADGMQDACADGMEDACAVACEPRAPWHANRGRRATRTACAAPRGVRALTPALPLAPHAAQDGNKHVGLKLDRIRYWLSAGAQPSPPVARLLGQAGVIPPPPPRTHQGQTKQPDKQRNKKG